jgi:hypothetical protein
MAWLDTLKAALLFFPRQLWAFGGNVWTWLTENLHLRDILLPAIYDTLVWLSNQVPLVFGAGEPGEMIEASFVLGVAAVISSLISFGATLALVVVFAVTGTLGFLRFFPAVESRWPVPEYRLGDSGSLGVL